MNTQTVHSRFATIIGAWLALVVGVPALAGKPAPPDACSTATDFPAFAYVVPASGKRPSTIYVSDATGKCARVLIAGSAPKLSYPVDGVANKGRVVWRDYSSIASVDFTVGGNNVITVEAKRTLYTNPSCCSLDLSKDGRTVYFTDTDASIATLDASTQAVNRVYELPTGAPWFFSQASVNGDGTQLYATKTGNQSNSGGSQLVRIDLTTTPATEVLLREWLPQDGYGPHSFWPAADQYVDRVAFHEYIEGSNNCTPLVVTDKDGNQLYPSLAVPARFGRSPTWAGNNVVMERRTPMDGSGKCGSTTSITEVDLTTNAETVLTTGIQPNGR